ncbi:hypothetical protein CI105_07285 [Candidatus Izimaplasma bacterium ZiA1]|uniref:hypothetical protein n=1 Tax=Candidatus Izimoplasma sp. ZiA1 TaxID=2024899 RepID=UPI000BAA7808|nr:hypothetical protein CI105_07285 [Candidatus Izimaplasma bacterium ZiA1]
MKLVLRLKPNQLYQMSALLVIIVAMNIFNIVQQESITLSIALLAAIVTEVFITFMDTRRDVITIDSKEIVYNYLLFKRTVDNSTIERIGVQQTRKKDKVVIFYNVNDKNKILVIKDVFKTPMSEIIERLNNVMKVQNYLN